MSSSSTFDEVLDAIEHLPTDQQSHLLELRPLIPSTALGRAAKKLGKKNAITFTAIREALKLLGQDAFDPLLRTPKLAGTQRRFAGSIPA
jgi:hypothetical protein